MFERLFKAFNTVEKNRKEDPEFNKYGAKKEIREEEPEMELTPDQKRQLEVKKPTPEKAMSGALEDIGDIKMGAAKFQGYAQTPQDDALAETRMKILQRLSGR